MLRKLHAVPALVAGLIVVFMSVTGAILSQEPVLQALGTPPAAVAGAQNVAALAASAVQHVDGVERIVRRASGTLIALGQTDAGPTASVIDTAGQVVAPYEPSAFFSFMTELHRALLSGDTGRVFAAVAAAALAVLSVGGVFLLVKRLGGWRKLFVTAKGSLSQRLHVELSRLGVLVLTVLSVSGLYLALNYFGLVGASEDGFVFPPQSTGTAAMAVADMSALAGVPLSDLRELVFPAAGDVADVFSVTTAAGSGYIDQTTGAWLDFTANSAWDNIYQLAYTLHTGAGVWWYALLLGLGSLTVPVLFGTGLIIWALRQRSKVRVKGNAPADTAETVILVGSEGNTTWGFARTLFSELTANGTHVHLAAMNDLKRRYPRARNVIVLTATYGDGDAPASARSFMSRLEAFEPQPGQGFAVLGFGDRSFPDYCGYAKKVEEALDHKGLTPLVHYATINRQSAQGFAEWGQDVGTALGRKLTLRHEAELPRSERFVVESRRDYGRDYQTPKVILRLRPLAQPGLLERLGLHQRYRAGDLIGIVPPGDSVPRYYSLASAARDGFIEICVALQPGGKCSTLLCNLQPGEEISGFFRVNESFRAPRTGKPLILIGAGTGIAPFIGHLRANRSHRPMFLYWGGRDPASDFLFRQELMGFRKDGRLSGARIVFSRAASRRYVQDELRDDAEFLRDSVAHGARVLICGGAGMARGVTAALDDILAPLSLDTNRLKQTGRLAEDIF